jgi:SAM-dependent methyltransferase
MRVDASTLQKFYAAPWGRAALAMTERRLAALWPHARGLDVLGFGYPTPYLERLAPEARRTVALAPAAQGAVAWGRNGGAGASALGEEGRLPLIDSAFDRVLLVHALEESDSPRLLLREIWRVTAPEGRIAVVVANRAGLWSRVDATPFGHGRPFSRTQLNRLLRDAMFEPTATARALYAPPINWGPLMDAAEGFERVGERLWPPFGGLLLMEAVKRVEIGPAPTKGRAAPVRVQPAAEARRDARGRVAAASHLRDARAHSFMCAATYEGESP